MRRLLIFFTALFFLSTARAIPFDQVLNPQTVARNFVQDSGQVLSPEYFHLINNICATLKSATTAELAVVTVDDLEGYEVKDYAQKLGQKWGVGGAEKKNGLIILLSRDDRQVAIQVGYGLEAVITDATSGRLLDEWALPHLRAGHFGRGLYELAKATAKKVAEAQGVPLTINDPAVWPEEAIIPTSQATKSADQTLSKKWFFIYSLGTFFLIFLGIGWTALRVFLSKSMAFKNKILDNKKDVLPIVLWVAACFIAFPLVSISFSSLGSGAFYFFGYLILLYIFFIFRRKIRGRFKKFAAQYRMACPKCKKPMALLGEREDNKYLNEGEIAEELAQGMDYEFWRCTPCDYLHRLDVALGHGAQCPKCRKKSLTSSSTTIQAATTSRSGQMQVNYKCLNPSCAYQHQETRIIPQISQSSGSGRGSWGGGSSGGGSFGGGSFGGGGASRRF